MGVALKPIKPKRISDQVFEQLSELIFRGELKPREQIMPERELSNTLNVSRTAVREAINKLVVMGLVEQKQGQGTFVRTRDERRNPMEEAMRTQGATLEDLIEIRMGLECSAVEMAGQRASEEDIEILEQRLINLRNEIAHGKTGMEEDIAFHMALAYATKNMVQVHLMRSLYDFLFYSVEGYALPLYKPEKVNMLLLQHEKIVDAIKKGDSSEASEAMREHIEYVMEYVKSRKSS